MFLPHIAMLMLAAVATAASPADTAPPPAKPVTSVQISAAIEKAKTWLLSRQQPDGLWPEEEEGEGDSEMAIWALRCTGLHPLNNEPLAKAYAADMDRSLKTTRAVSLQAMALCEGLRAISPAFAGRDKFKTQLVKDAQWIVAAQGKSGGWGPAGLAGGDGATNLQDTLWAVRGLSAAMMYGTEVPGTALERARTFVLQAQQTDGSWSEGPEQSGDVGVTREALAAMLFLDREGAAGSLSDAGRDQPIVRAMDWLRRPGPADPAARRDGPAALLFYSSTRTWLPSSTPSVGMQGGPRETAERLVRSQRPDGEWGDLSSTCLAAVFLDEARSPLTFAKMAAPGCEWNARSWDIGNLTNYMSRSMQQYFAWEVVGPEAPLSALQEAPVLVISPSDPPTFSEEEKKKLRAYTDSGGTILVLDPGGVVVGAWFQRFAKEAWPEWPVKPLAADHAVFRDPNVIRVSMPEILGVDDGLCTRVFFGPFGAGQAWQSLQVAAREHMFKWGLNLFRYATDRRPLRSGFWTPPPVEPKPQVSLAATLPAKPEAKRPIQVCRLKYGGNWVVGRNYKGFEVITAAMAERIGIRLKVDESGAEPADLLGADVAYLAGSAGVKLGAKEQADLKAYLAKGGFVWVEAAGGSEAFDGVMLRLALDLGWTLRIIDKTHPLMTGQFGSAAGYDLTSGVQFQRGLRILRLGRGWAELVGIYQDGRLVGVYSPFDVVFSATDYPAYGCRGYAPEDAKAVAANILLYASDRPAGDMLQPGKE